MNFVDTYRKAEILAPAGSLQQLQASVNAGADAVYLGLKSFSARQNAENFSDEELSNAVQYAHERDVRVYVALNTLVEDGELRSMEQAVQVSAEARVDALIVQDLALARTVKRLYPDIPLFASTQMAVHNSWGARALQDEGFSRIVLARELSLEEIKLITEKVDIDVEVFVHGAHCMSVSGNCYLSAMIGGRSGNRGLCAQPCRLNFQVGGREYALSLKDLSFMSHLKALQDIGVHSFKIEGRMKRPEYAAEAVRVCKNALGGSSVDTRKLKAVFSRSGFTDGYLTGMRGPSMFGYRTKEDVDASMGIIDDIAREHQKKGPDIAVDAFLKVQEHKPSELSLSDGRFNVTVFGEIPQTALKVQLGEEQAERYIKKTGGTPYSVQRFSAVIEDGLTLSASQLNALRRAALAELSQRRADSPVWERHYVASEKLPPYSPSTQKELRLRFESAGQIFPEAKKKRMILPISEIENNQSLISDMGNALIGEIPSLIFPEDEQAVCERLHALHGLGLRHVLCDNIGAVRLAREIGFELHGGPSLNIMNSQALAFYEGLNLLDATLSIELSFSKVRKMKGALRRGVIGYGYLPLMKMRACPAQGEGGCGGCSGIRVLTDRKGETFTLLCRQKKYTELLNCVPLYIADKPVPSLDFETLYFTTEDQDQCKYIMQLYEEHSAVPFRRTGGLYYRDLL